MKRLSDFVSHSLVTERIERKFLMPQGHSSTARAFLISNGFVETYRARMVRSVYFDTKEYSCLRDNIDGNPFRDKLRVRFYDANYSTARIEIKHKRNMLGYKSMIPLNGIFGTEYDVVDATKRWSSLNVSEFLVPTARVTYLRRYYTSGWLRATIDTDIQSEAIIGNKYITSPGVQYEVVEFKYESMKDAEMRLLFDRIASFSLRTTKSSKYSNALVGLI